MQPGLLLASQRGALIDFLERAFGAEVYPGHAAYIDRNLSDRVPSWFEKDFGSDYLPASVVWGQSGIQALALFHPYDLAHPAGMLKCAQELEWYGSQQMAGAGGSVLQHVLSLVDFFSVLGSNSAAWRSLLKGPVLYALPEVPRVAIPVTWKAMAGWPGLEWNWRELVDSMARAVNVSMVADAAVDYTLVRASAAREGWDSCSCVGAFCTCARYGKSRLSRSRHWLEWRYANAADDAYFEVRPKGVGRHGLFFRRERVSGTECQVFRVLDVVCGDSCNYCSVAPLLHAATNEGVALVDFVTTNADTAAAFGVAAERAGFWAYGNPALPFLFQPLETRPYRSPNLLLLPGSRWPSAELRGNLLGRIRDAGWFATRSDSHQDGPPLIVDPATS